MRIVVNNQNAAHYGLPPSTMRLTDSAIDRVKIFAGANQCVILISASMGVTVCPARCLGPIMEPGSLHKPPSPSCVDHLARRGSPADRNEPTPSHLRSIDHLLQSLPAAFEALLQYLEWSSWSGKLSWLSQRAVDPCQRKAVSRMANALQRACSALTFLAAMSLQHSYFCCGTEWSTLA